MSDAVRVYRRWAGVLRAGPVAPTIVVEELKRAWRNQWSRLAIFAVFMYTALYIGQVYTLGQRPGGETHTIENFLGFMDDIRWGALAIAAIMAGPSLLEDARRGALELYLARPVSKAGYLSAKIAAVLGASFVTLYLPALLYFLVSYLVFDTQPTSWALVPARAAVYAAMWAVPVSGIGMGLSCVARSGRTATLVLFGGFATLEIVVADLLSAIAGADTRFQVLSPAAALSAQKEWLFQIVRADEFPWWWGAIELAGLALVGWGLVAWRHPRLAGEGRP